MKDQVNGLMQKEMDRLTFLKHVGIGFVAITGASAVVKTLTSLNIGQSSAPSAGLQQGQITGTANKSYGTSVYGGRRNVASY